MGHSWIEELKIIITASAIDFADDISTLMKKKKKEREIRKQSEPKKISNCF